jgi:hypothetical protein
MANAPGTGIADDKVIYAYVPEIIKYYTGEEIILAQRAHLHLPKRRRSAYVLDHLDQLVVKAANESGGYGMLVGPHAIRMRNGPPLQRRSRLSRATIWPSPPSRFPGCPPSWATASRAPRGPSPLCPFRKRDLRAARWPDTGGPAQRVAGGQLFARGRQ